MTRHLRALAAVASALAAVACGGGAALLHPAHVLAEGTVSGGAGVESNFALGEAARRVDRASPASGTAPGTAEQRYVEGAIASALVAPGLSPWAGARAGLGGRNEGGLTYTGRSVRIDARHAFGGERVALSVGLGGSGVLMHPGSQDAAGGGGATSGRLTGSPGDISATGYGLDAPILVGWRSRAQVAQLWAGARAGFERVMAGLPLDSRLELDTTARASGTRVYAGGLVGAAIGIQPIWVALEVDVAYQAYSGTVTFPETSGTPTERDTRFSGVTLAPAGAIIGKF